MNRPIAYVVIRASIWLFAACGDDGTDRLSACPGGRIESDKTGILRCADDEPTETAGNRATQTDTPAAGSGDGARAGSWHCQQVETACSCVSNKMASDTCATPRPTCCVEVKHDTAAAQSCICYPEGSPECSGAKMNPSLYTPIPACPPL